MKKAIHGAGRPTPEADDEASATRDVNAPMSFQDEKRSVAAVGAAAGEVVGAVVGAGAGPVGAVAGMVIGALAGHLAASTIEDEQHDAAARDSKLDEAIGVTSGTIGAGALKSRRQRRREQRQANTRSPRR
jgi:hypothetical protein